MTDLSRTVWNAHMELECTDCDREIRAGDEVGTVDDAIVCFGCWVGAGGDEDALDRTDDEDD